MHVDLAVPMDQAGTLFIRKGGTGRSPKFHYAIGVALLLAAALCFGLALRDYFPPSVISLPIMAALAAFATGYQISSSAERIFVGEQELILFYANRKRVIPWTALRWSATESSSLNQQTYLNIYNSDGRKEIRVPPAFHGFDHLVVLVREKIAEVNEGAEFRIPLERNWQRASFLIGIGLALAALAFFLLVSDHQDLVNGVRLAAEGVAGEGTITEHYLAPNGKNSRIEYEVAGTDGTTGTDNVEIERALWEKLSVGDTVQVRYLPDAPHVSELTAGLVKSRYADPQPVKVYAMPIAVLIICLFLVGTGVMTMCGIDIDWDQKTRKFKVKRLGRD